MPALGGVPAGFVSDLLRHCRLSPSCRHHARLLRLFETFTVVSFLQRRYRAHINQS